MLFLTKWNINAMEWDHVTKEAHYCLKYLYMFLYMYAVQSVHSVRLLIIPRIWTEGIRKPRTHLFFLDTSPAFSVCAGWWERTPDISGLCCSWAWTTGLGKITKSQAFKYNLVQSSFKSKTNRQKSTNKQRGALPSASIDLQLHANTSVYY